MSIEVAASLRHTDRKRLLGYLLKLDDVDPGERARAALDASDLLRRKGLDWSALVPADRAEPATVAVPHNWQRRALAMAQHPSVTPDERNFLNKLAGWKAPGRGNLERMQGIAERLGWNCEVSEAGRAGAADGRADAGGLGAGRDVTQPHAR